MGAAMTRKLNQAKLHSRLRQSPSLFFAHLFPKIDNTEGFECPWYLHAISQHLLEMYNGQCQRLIINTAPQSLKTSMPALHGLLSEGSNYGRLRTQLKTGSKLVKAAEERLRQS